MGRYSVILSMAAAVGFSAPASAERLPAGARGLSEQEVRALYQDRSADWPKARAYFSAEGAVVLVRKDNSRYGEGRWTVNGNKMCMTVKWVGIESGKRGTADDCYTWYQSGGRYLTLWSGNYDKSDGYSADERSRLSKGDQVSEDFAALKGS